MIIEKQRRGFGVYVFKITILNQEITVGELRLGIENVSHLEICFPENDNELIKIKAEYGDLNETLEKAKKIISKKMYLLADQILCSLKETRKV